jgi:transposase
MAHRHPKWEFLKAAGALNAHPELVRARLFEEHRFFDPLDKVQVKYEMLRLHAVDGETVKTAARGFGFSRQTFYTTARAFEELGIVGLTDEKRGRRGRVKVGAEDLVWIEGLVGEDPGLSGRAIAARLSEERGVEVHRRTVERILAQIGKKNR